MLSAQPNVAEDVSQFLEAPGFVKGGREFCDDALDADEIEAGAMEDQQPFDVLLVLRPERDGLVDDQVLGARHGHACAGDLERLRCCERVELERQPGDRQIDIDVARLVPKEEHLIGLGKRHRVIDARDELVRGKPAEEFRQIERPACHFASTSRVSRGTPRAITAIPPMIMPGTGRAASAVATACTAARRAGFSVSSAQQRVS